VTSANEAVVASRAAFDAATLKKLDAHLRTRTISMLGIRNSLAFPCNKSSDREGLRRIECRDGVR
jgi:hypothetical protein